MKFQDLLLSLISQSFEGHVWEGCRTAKPKPATLSFPNQSAACFIPLAAGQDFSQTNAPDMSTCCSSALLRLTNAYGECGGAPTFKTTKIKTQNTQSQKNLPGRSFLSRCTWISYLWLFSPSSFERKNQTQKPKRLILLFFFSTGANTTRQKISTSRRRWSVAIFAGKNSIRSKAPVYWGTLELITLALSSWQRSLLLVQKWGGTLRFQWI